MAIAALSMLLGVASGFVVAVIAVVPLTVTSIGDHRTRVQAPFAVVCVPVCP